MTQQARKFEAVDAAVVREPKPLLVGITSPSGGGKTFSALKLATGMQRVTGGEIYLGDTEAGRSLQYQDIFKFKYVKFAPPHSPAAYEDLIHYCVGNGAKIVILDSMTHEHSGEGGVLDQIDEYLERKSKGNFDERERYKWTAQIEPKRQRKALNNTIEQLGGKVIFIFCYRAEDKTKPSDKKGEKPIHLGWTAETTSKLPYMMTVRFLLPPGADGKPNLTPDTEFEKLSIKMPIQFRDWFKPGLQLNEDLGERLARWSLGQDAPGAPTSRAEQKQSTPPPVVDRITDDEWEDVEARLAAAPDLDSAKSIANQYRHRMNDDQRKRTRTLIENHA